MNVKFIIEATEWKFEETLPFAIEKISDTLKDFNLPLFDEEGEETNNIVLPNCRVIELEGEEESFHVVFEESVIANYEKTELDSDEIEIHIQLKVEKSLWQQGEDSGIFYSWENLPAELKELNVQSEQE